MAPFLALGPGRGINMSFVMTYQDGIDLVGRPYLSMALAANEGTGTASGSVSRRYYGDERRALLAWLDTHAESMPVPSMHLDGCVLIEEEPREAEPSVECTPHAQGFASPEAKARWLAGADGCSDQGISGFSK